MRSGIRRMVHGKHKCHHPSEKAGQTSSSRLQKPLPPPATPCRISVFHCLALQASPEFKGINTQQKPRCAGQPCRCGCAGGVYRKILDQMAFLPLSGNRMQLSFLMVLPPVAVAPGGPGKLASGPGRAGASNNLLPSHGYGLFLHLLHGFASFSRAVLHGPPREPGLH